MGQGCSTIPSVTAASPASQENLQLELWTSKSATPRLGQKRPCYIVCKRYMSQPQNYQRPLYQRRFIQYWFFAFSLENDRGLTKNDTPEHGLCWTFELELPKSNLCTVPVLKAATCDLEVAASKQKPLRLTRDRRKLRPSSWSCRSVTCALRLW